jgi:hypothetical protein
MEVAMRTTAFGRRTWIASALLLLVMPAPARAVDVTQILTHLHQALEPGKNMRASFEIEISNAKGEDVRWRGTYYRKSGPDGAMRLLFDYPMDLRGTDVVVRRGADGSSRTRVYYPFIRRVREIDGDRRGESFLGTDFNYEDLGLNDQDLDLQPPDIRQQKLLPDERGQHCYRMESIPSRGWWYGRIIRCIDRKSYLPLRTEYYDRSGILWKVRTFDEVKTINAFPTATRITMRTIPTGTSTRITLSEITYNTDLSDALFEGP